MCRLISKKAKKVYGIDINNNPWFMWAADWNSTDVSLDFTTDAAVLNIRH